MFYKCISARNKLFVPSKAYLSAACLNFRYKSTSNKNLVNVNVDDKTCFAELSLNNGVNNTFSSAMCKELVQSIDEVTRAGVKGISLTSSAENIFSRGMDLTELIEPDEEDLERYLRLLHAVWYGLFSSRIPIVAAINGHCNGVASAFALACDYRIMLGPHFTFGFDESRFSLLHPGWYGRALNHVVEPRLTEYCLVQSELFCTADAAALGLVDEMIVNVHFPIEHLKNVANEKLVEFNKPPFEARAMTKLMCRQETLSSCKEINKQEVENFVSYILKPAVQKQLFIYNEAIFKGRVSNETFVDIMKNLEKDRP